MYVRDCVMTLLGKVPGGNVLTHMRILWCIKPGIHPRHVVYNLVYNIYVRS